MAAIAQMRDTAADRTLTWDEAVRGSTGDLQVKRDLDILVGAACDQKRSLELNRELTLPFFDVAQAKNAPAMRPRSGSARRSRSSML